MGLVVASQGAGGRLSASGLFREISAIPENKNPGRRPGRAFGAAIWVARRAENVLLFVRFVVVCGGGPSHAAGPSAPDGIVECGAKRRWACLPVVVDVLAQVVTKGGAASDMFGNMQSPVIHTEEQS